MIPLLSGWPALFATVLIGLIFGSFASALSYRIPRHESWVSSRSRCTSCQHLLSFADLVPFFSWAFLRGRCRHCRAAIGIRYPLIELSTLLLCVAVFLSVGLTPQGCVMILAMPFLVALIAIDLDHMILPDQLNIILFILGLIFVGLGGVGMIPMAVISAVIYAGVLFLTGWLMTKMLKRDAVGFGDVKFLGVAGLWIGLGMLPVFLILSGLCGVIFGLIWKMTGRGAVFPFGPAIIASFIICLLFGAQMGDMTTAIFR